MFVQVLYLFCWSRHASTTDLLVQFEYIRILFSIQILQHGQFGFVYFCMHAEQKVCPQGTSTISRIGVAIQIGHNLIACIAAFMASAVLLLAEERSSSFWRSSIDKAC